MGILFVGIFLVGWGRLWPPGVLDIYISGFDDDEIELDLALNTIATDDL